MAAPSYTHDLTDWIADADTAAWSELTGAAGGALPDEADTESALQGTNTVSQSTASATIACGMGRVLGTPVTFTSGQVALVWHGHGVATALDLYANNGLQVAFIGATIADWKGYAVGGSDTPPFPYGKWVNNPVDPSLTAQTSNGTPPTGGTNIYGIGSIVELTQAVAKGQPHVCDMIRYGRAEARFKDGDLANGYATFSGFATLNDATSARWGLIQAVQGGYQWKGLMTLGYTAAVDFRDSNLTVFVQDCRKVASTFNKIEIRQALSRVDWTGISIVCVSPATTASKGSLAVIDNADVNFDFCTFTDMDTFTFLANSTVLNTIFRRCAQVAVAGGTFTGCTFDRSTVASAVLAATPANAALISNSDFISDGTGHAIEITGTAANFTLTNNTYTSYAASNGSTGNEAIFVNIASGTPIVISITGGDTPTIRTAGVAVTVQNAVTVKVTVKDANTLVAIPDARVLLEAAAGGNLHAGVAVAITNTTTTANVTHNGHGMATGTVVVIRGVTQDPYNGIYSITNTGTNTYTYTMASDPGASASGSPTVTNVILNDVTNASGILQTTAFNYTANQPVTGKVRKATTGTKYRTGAITGTITSAGLDTTILLIADE